MSFEIDLDEDGQAQELEDTGLRIVRISRNRVDLKESVLDNLIAVIELDLDGEIVRTLSNPLTWTPRYVWFVLRFIFGRDFVDDPDILTTIIPLDEGKYRLKGGLIYRGDRPVNKILSRVPLEGGEYHLCILNGFLVGGYSIPLEALESNYLPNAVVRFGRVAYNTFHHTGALAEDIRDFLWVNIVLGAAYHPKGPEINPVALIGDGYMSAFEDTIRRSKRRYLTALTEGKALNNAFGHIPFQPRGKGIDFKSLADDARRLGLKSVPSYQPDVYDRFIEVHNKRADTLQRLLPQLSLNVYFKNLDAYARVLKESENYHIEGHPYYDLVRNLFGYLTNLSYETYPQKDQYHDIFSDLGAGSNAELRDALTYYLVTTPERGIPSLQRLSEEKKKASKKKLIWIIVGIIISILLIVTLAAVALIVVRYMTHHKRGVPLIKILKFWERIE